MNPKISIIIPVYNAEKYIKRCINTIKKQTYDNIEIVCVNDGSTDKSLEILKKLQKYDNRIIIVDQENKGPFAARKNGIFKSTGDYILFCDADDLLPNKESCDVLIKKFNENKDVQIIHFGSVKCMHKFIKVEKTSCLTGKVTFEQLKQDYYEDYIGNSKENAISVVLWDKIYKSEIVKRAVCKMDFNLKMGEDLCLNLLVFD
ncbi:MAG: glycosyltransferase family A protein, partial [Ruminococcus sp.]|nr:glycosyltransferase family A protein [Ruminococcus sp.]